jgi:hypothetical protein
VTVTGLDRYLEAIRGDGAGDVVVRQANAVAAVDIPAAVAVGAQALATSEHHTAADTAVAETVVYAVIIPIAAAAYGFALREQLLTESAGLGGTRVADALAVLLRDRVLWLDWKSKQADIRFTSEHDLIVQFLRDTLSDTVVPL